MSISLLARMATLCALLAVVQVARSERNDQLLLDATAETPDAIRTLESLVTIESGTGTADGMASLAQLLEHRLGALGATVTRSKAASTAVGDNIVGTIYGRGGRRILLMAHMDTVYPLGTLAKMPFRIEGDRAYGPGIADDKSGIAVILHALALLKSRGFTDFGSITVLFNTDEERGSVGSRDLIQQLAAQHDAVLSFEPTFARRESLALATSGIASYSVTVKGAPAHAGFNPDAGVNALLEASDIVVRTVDLDDKARNVRFNWTIARSGTALNVIPDTAFLEADIRYANKRDFDELLSALDQRINHKRLAKSDVSISVDAGRPAFNAGVGGRVLVEKAVSIYKEIGAELHVIELAAAGTDAAYASQAGVPVIEFLGLPGFGFHSNQAEYVMIDAFPRRLYLAARLIMDLGRGV